MSEVSASFDIRTLQHTSNIRVYVCVCMTSVCVQLLRACVKYGGL